MKEFIPSMVIMKALLYLEISPMEEGIRGLMFLNSLPHPNANSKEWVVLRNF